MIAIVLSELDQFTALVTSEVEPSENISVAENCCVEPTTKLVEEDGIITTEDKTGATTVNVTDELVTPDKVAVILAVPIATPVAKPAGEIVTLVGLELDQFTWDVIYVVELSE
jgi:hypothetical protein